MQSILISRAIHGDFTRDLDIALKQLRGFEYSLQFSTSSAVQDNVMCTMYSALIIYNPQKA